MEMPNAIKVCKETGEYIYCEKCPIYPECSAQYKTTEEFERVVEKAATEYLKGSSQ